MELTVTVHDRPTALKLALAADNHVSTANDMQLIMFCDASFHQLSRMGGIGLVFKPLPAKQMEIALKSRAWPLKSISDINLGEMVAISESLAMATNEIRAALEVYPEQALSVKVMTDSHASLRHLGKKSSHRPRVVTKIDHVVDLIRMQVKALKGLGTSITVVFQWCPGHNGVPQHDQADSLACQASISQLSFSSCDNNNFLRFVQATSMKILLVKFATVSVIKKPKRVRWAKKERLRTRAFKGKATQSTQAAQAKRDVIMPPVWGTESCPESIMDKHLHGISNKMAPFRISPRIIISDGSRRSEFCLVYWTESRVMRLPEIPSTPNNTSTKRTAPDGASERAAKRQRMDSHSAGRATPIDGDGRA